MNREQAIADITNLTFDMQDHGMKVAVVDGRKISTIEDLIEATNGTTPQHIAQYQWRKRVFWPNDRVYVFMHLGSGPADEDRMREEMDNFYSSIEARGFELDSRPWSGNGVIGNSSTLFGNGVLGIDLGMEEELGLIYAKFCPAGSSEWIKHVHIMSQMPKSFQMDMAATADEFNLEHNPIIPLEKGMMTPGCACHPDKVEETAKALHAALEGLAERQGIPGSVRVVYTIGTADIEADMNDQGNTPGMVELGRALDESDEPGVHRASSDDIRDLFVTESFDTEEEFLDVIEQLLEPLRWHDLKTEIYHPKGYGRRMTIRQKPDQIEVYIQTDTNDIDDEDRLMDPSGERFAESIYALRSIREAAGDRFIEFRASPITYYENPKFGKIEKSLGIGVLDIDNGTWTCITGLDAKKGDKFDIEDIKFGWVSAVIKTR